EPLELAFNARYFIDVLQNMESTEVELGFVDNSKPCVITGESDEGFLGLIMPMRI
ncbi:MAG: DNA polymerase III subunit beta, partial [Deltaproteobacteria bacterium]|nr:DNA polymerase III subunit beta [Deltaproteobacteria bacterium]MBW2083447.1 DNA polymerase III subunit beta [Deltaproteobacteria bacterium]